jgi:hypothetical protein
MRVRSRQPGVPTRDQPREACRARLQKACPGRKGARLVTRVLTRQGGGAPRTGRRSRARIKSRLPPRPTPLSPPANTTAAPGTTTAARGPRPAYLPGLPPGRGGAPGIASGSECTDGPHRNRWADRTSPLVHRRPARRLHGPAPARLSCRGRGPAQCRARSDPIARRVPVRQHRPIVTARLCPAGHARPRYPFPTVTPFMP